MGLTDMLAQNLPKAIEDLKNAVRYMPNHIGTWHALAWCMIVSNDLASARESFDKAMEIDHNFGETHGGLAVIAVMEGRLTEAEGLIKRALRLDPRSFAARFAQSLMLAQRGKPEVAQELIQKILKSPVMEGGESLQDILLRTMPHRNAKTADMNQNGASEKQSGNKPH
jgi:Tfp pilus assembly protein PilF